MDTLVEIYLNDNRFRSDKFTVFSYLEFYMTFSTNAAFHKKLIFKTIFFSNREMY